MKTLSIQIIYTHTDPIKRAELSEELEAICEQYDANITINSEY